MTDKFRNGGTWTEARYRSFIKGGLRSISNRWPPKYVVKKAAWVSRGVYKCIGHKRRSHNVPVSEGPVGKKTNNVFVDHIIPIIDPQCGFTTWDRVIDRMFVEAEGMQLLCTDCHKLKTADERKQRIK